MHIRLFCSGQAIDSCSKKSGLTAGWMIDLMEEKVMLAEEAYRIIGIDKKDFDKTFKGIMTYVHPDDNKNRSSPIRSYM
jgi:hypothetical protein